MDRTILRRPELDDRFSRFTLKERAEASKWLRIIDRFEGATDKMAEFELIKRDYAGLKGLSKSGLYRRIEAVKEFGIEGLMSASARRRGSEADIGLPLEFVRFWQGLCGQNQRRKARAAYRRLFQDWLIPGKVIPGYGCDWRGIWAQENPGTIVPDVCPYQIRINVPRGWSYRNLISRKPDADVWTGSAVGVGAMRRAGLPSVPHTRVGLPFATVYVVDDVWHDLKVNYVSERQAERPLELGMMELKTGRYVSWGVTPVRRNPDGSREMLKESYMRYLLADLLCRVGVNRSGVTILAEHGTAAIRGDLLKSINREIKIMTGVDDFLKISTSSVTGAPIAKGMFIERACGNPRHKAALESSWNLLHNETAHLIGQVGRNRDASPADISGRDRENNALIKIANALVTQSPDAARALISGSCCGYMNYTEFCDVLIKIKGIIENRIDHDLEGWEGCHYTHQVATIQGANIDLSILDPEKAKQVGELVKTLGAPVRCVPLSPLAAYQLEEGRTDMIVFPASLAARILMECGKKTTVENDGTIILRDDFSHRKVVCSAIVEDCRGCDIALQRGRKVVAILNPFDCERAFVSDLEGRYIGQAAAFVAGQFADPESDRRNMALYAKSAADMRKRLEPVISQQRKERRQQIENATNVLLSVGSGSDSESAIERASEAYSEDPILTL